MSVEESTQVVQGENGINLEVVNRITKLPVVESTIETATNIYGKVKDYNTVTNWTLSTAESTAHKAVEIAMPYAVPVVNQLKEPINKVDNLLCGGLDYIEEKIPAVKLPPGEMYTGAKDIVTNTVGTGVDTAKYTVEAAKHMVEPAVETARNTVEAAKHIVEPAVETAKHYIEPAVETAKHYIDPALEKAYALKDYGVQQVEKILHPKSEEAALECEECLNNQKEESSSSSDM